MQLNGTNGFGGPSRGAVDGAGEHLFAGSGFAGQQHRDGGGRDPARERQQFGHLFRNPQTAVGLECIGGPECGALLLVAPGLVEGNGGVDQLPDGHGGTPIAQRVAHLGDDFPGFVAMGPAGDAKQFAGVLGRFACLGLRPVVGGDEANGLVAAGDEGPAAGGSSHSEDGIGLVGEDVGVAGEFDEREGIVKALRGFCARKAGAFNW